MIELALIGLSLAVFVFWLAQAIADHMPRLPRRQPPAVRVPHWARTGHLPTSPSSAASGRHRRGGAR